MPLLSPGHPIKLQPNDAPRAAWHLRRKEPRNTPRCPGTKPAMDGCSSTRGPDEICKKHPALAGRLSTADHPSDRALPASRLTAYSSGNRVAAARLTKAAELSNHRPAIRQAAVSN